MKAKDASPGELLRVTNKHAIDAGYGEIVEVLSVETPFVDVRPQGRDEHGFVHESALAKIREREN